jgi:hypothetical protein
MNFIAVLLARYLGQRDKRSRASILYEEAHLRGGAPDQLREKLRRGVREILAFYIFAVLASFLYLDRPSVSEDQIMLPALILAAVVGPSCWLAYRVIRFALAR